MKILLLSDLHLFDVRMTPQRDLDRLEKLASFITGSGAEAVLNLGDTVSKASMLRPECPSIEDGFRHYLRWRSQFRILFIECAITRELAFFTSLSGQPPNAVFDCEGVSIIAMVDHTDFSPEQMAFLTGVLARSRREGRKVVIGTHIPYPGSCSHPDKIKFLHIPPELHRTLTEFPQPVWWCGGHFHSNLEQPMITGSLTALYGGRFRLDTRNDTTYLRIIDTESGQIDTQFPDF